MLNPINYRNKLISRQVKKRNFGSYPRINLSGRVVGGAFSTTTSHTWTADQIFTSKAIVRKAGGVAGTDEVQITHDGTNGHVKSMDGQLSLYSTGNDQAIVFRRSADNVIAAAVLTGTGASGLCMRAPTFDVTGYNSTAVDGSASLNSAGVRLVRTVKVLWANSAWYNTPDTALANPAASVVSVTDGTTGLGKLVCGTLIEPNTAGSGSPNILTTQESRTCLTNEGATAQNYHTLPTAVAGLDFEFACQDSDGIRIIANTGDTIRDVGTVSASAGYIQSTVVGSVVRLKAINSVEWFVFYKQGTWTIDS